MSRSVDVMLLLFIVFLSSVQLKFTQVYTVHAPAISGSHPHQQGPELTGSTSQCLWASDFTGKPKATSLSSGLGVTYLEK